MNRHKMHNQVSLKNGNSYRKARGKPMKRHSYINIKNRHGVQCSARQHNQSMQRTVRLSECAAGGSVVFFDRATASDLKR